MEFLREFWDEAIAVGAGDLGHVLLRSFIVVMVVFAIFRFIGERTVAQLDIFGLLLLIGLGSAVGDPMFYRDVPVSLALLSVFVVIGTFKLLAGMTARIPAMSGWITPEPIPLVEAGVLSEEGLKRADLSREEFVSLARLHGVESVDEIKTSFLEVNGQVSVIRWPQSGGG